MHLRREMRRFEVVDLSSRRGDRNRYADRDMRLKKSSAWLYISCVLLMLTLILMLIGWCSKPWHPYRQFLTLSDNFRIAVESRGLDARIAFFNSEFGPYSGSIIGFVGDDEKVYPPIQREIGFGDTGGIYYRYFKWSDRVLWTLSISLWYPVALFSAWPSYRALRRRSGSAKAEA